MSVYDYAFAKHVWNGKLPVKIILDPTGVDLGNGKEWDPIYLEVPRCSYLPLVTRRIQKIMKDLDMQFPDESFQSAWYEADHLPLKWHYPIGLLFDLHANTLPWTLTIHFTDLPTESILLKPTPESMQDMFMSMVKEADFLRFGTTKKVMNLSKRDSTQLWQSLASDQYDDFRAVNKQLTEYSNNLRDVPIKVYLPDQCPVIQGLVPFHQDSEIPILSQVVTKLIPALDEQTLASVLVVTHGIELPLDMPIHWAYENLCYADNFLHLVIKQKE
ncbi:putative autophagy protein [Choanephora cucurbitarum]|nr:putative autophagy protein [Choanephora cucurbitarum]